MKKTDYLSQNLGTFNKNFELGLTMCYSIWTFSMSVKFAENLAKLVRKNSYQFIIL